MKVVIACRHGEAFKNLKDIYGGQGSGLTDTGIAQVDALSLNIQKLVRSYGMPVELYRSCERKHIIETSERIRESLGLRSVYTDDNFRPIRLGVFDGMSGERQRLLYPTAAEAHGKWVRGEIDITESECLVPGMQRAEDYYNQVSDFLQGLSENQVYVLVGTRSDLSSLENVFRGQSPKNRMQYKCYDFSYTDMIMAEVMSKSIRKVDAKSRLKLIDLEEDYTI